MPDLFGGDHAHTVANGIRCVKLDPLTILTVLGMATERLGLGATCSTTYFEPFHVARVFATLDLVTDGRAAWNIVTSMNDGEALNMGHASHGEHDRRYDRADEFMEVVMGHWDAWEDGAIVADKATGLFAAPGQGPPPRPPGRVLLAPAARSPCRAAQGHPCRSRPARAAAASVSPHAGQNSSSSPITAWSRPGATTPPSRRRSQPPGATRKSLRLRRHLHRRRRNPRRGGGPRRPDRLAAKGDRQPVAAVGGPELRFRQAADRRAVHASADR